MRARFKELTGYDINTYFETFIDFTDNYYQNLIDYYKGTTSIDRETIAKLTYLNEQTDIVSELFDMYSHQLSVSAEAWELLSEFEEVKQKVGTILNTSKWTRSNVQRGNYTGNVSIDYTQKQGESLEDIANKSGYNNSDVDWGDIAIVNGLTEEDYSREGGSKMTVTLQNNSSIFISSVVDNLSGKKTYGKDISKELSFENNDIKVLDYDDTIKQAFGILISLTRGSVPQFPEDGIDKSLFIGRNLNSVAYPSIFRQLMQVFRKDDTFKELSVLNVYQEEGAMRIELQAKTRLEETINNKLTI